MMARAKAQERDRTADLVLTKDVLYRLSYLGISVEGHCRWLLTPSGLSHQPYVSWSGKRDSNPRPRAWKARALPTELFPPSKWWRGKDSNLRRHCRQIYSLLPLAARAPLLFSLPSTSAFSRKPCLRMTIPGAGDRI